MANEEIWRARVLAWRASGQLADEFSRGEEFSASSLRHWAWRLGLTRRRDKGKAATAAAGPVRLARVVRAMATPPSQLRRGTIRIEVGRARVEMEVDVDEEAFAMVMRVLDRQVRGAEEQR